MLRLKCRTQQYDWGKLGKTSSVALLNMASDAAFEPGNDVPYAEFWMGTHPNGPATLYDTHEGGGKEESLLGYLNRNPEAIGTVPAGSKAGDLPFMFKVLSIRKALSIQAHPDKTLAEHLHATQPEHYKDPNHKPEMAIALTNFEAMCGFRPLAQILDHLDTYPELGDIVGTVTPQDDKEAYLKNIFSNFMQAPDDLVHRKLEELVARLEASSPPAGGLNALILRLNTDFPRDRGALCPLILNYIHLQPGDAFFMGPNGPHAYISGDILECMALSDNTVRAGLSPKHKDVETLLQMLDYIGEDAGSHFMEPEQLSPYTILYRPPVAICSEFEVEKTELPAEIEYSPSVRSCCFLLIVISGECVITVEGAAPITCSQGHVYFVSAGTKLAVKTLSTEAVYYKAHVNMQNM